MVSGSKESKVCIWAVPSSTILAANRVAAGGDLDEGGGGGVGGGNGAGAGLDRGEMTAGEAAAAAAEKVRVALAHTPRHDLSPWLFDSELHSRSTTF